MAPCHSWLPLDPDSLDYLLCYVMNGAELMRLRKVSRALCGAVDTFAARRYDANKLLAPLVDDPTAFRQLQAVYDAVFSGSRVVKFFDDDGVYANDSDFDVFLHPRTAIHFGNHLIKKEKYTFQGPSWEAALAKEPLDDGFSIYDMAYARCVYKFARGSRRIDLIVCTFSPVHTILHFHSTPVVNGVTWNKAFSNFAAASWRKHEGVVLDVAHDNPAISKYRDRGFRICDARVGLQHSFADELSTGHRWIGDAHTWLIKLKTDLLNEPATQNVLERNSYVVTGLPVLTGINCLKTTDYRIEAIYFTHPLLSCACTLNLSLYRFAEAVLDCVSQRWVKSGMAFSARVRLNMSLTSTEFVLSWDRLFELACYAWRLGRPLAVEIARETATFYPLGGTVLTSRFL